MSFTSRQMKNGEMIESTELKVTPTKWQLPSIETRAESVDWVLFTYWQFSWRFLSLIAAATAANRLLSIQKREMRFFTFTFTCSIPIFFYVHLLTFQWVKPKLNEINVRPSVAISLLPLNNLAGIFFFLFRLFFR